MVAILPLAASVVDVKTESGYVISAAMISGGHANVIERAAEPTSNDHP